MSLAFLYAGQGTQKVGMGRELYETYPAFRAVFDSAPVEFDLKKLCFEGPEEQLSDTRYTQPCMVAFAAGVTALLYEAGIRPQAAAGLSLGEYSALQAAGVFTAPQAISLAAFRGAAMADAVQGRPCGMAAILGMEREPLLACCQEASGQGVCQIANYNCPGQLVVAGDQAAVDAACALAKERGARRCVPLKVSGPFHTSLMKSAGDALRERFASETFGQMAFPVIFNCLGRAKTETEEIPDLLERQVQSSVYFEDSIRSLEAMGVDTVVEIGPGKALSAFVKKTAKGIRILNVEDPASLEQTVDALKGEQHE